MSNMSAFSWPQTANIKLHERSEPVPLPDHRPLMIGMGVAAAAMTIIFIYTLFFFGLKYRKARATKQSKDNEAEAKTIVLKDNDPSPYVGAGHQGGDIGDSHSARTSSELPVHYIRVGKDGGKHDFVEVDISSEKPKN